MTCIKLYMIHDITSSPTNLITGGDKRHLDHCERQKRFSEHILTELSEIC